MNRRKPLRDNQLQAEGTGLEPATPLLGHHISSVAANHSLTLLGVYKSFWLLTFHLRSLRIQTVVSKTTPNTTPDTRFDTRSP